MPCIEGIYSLIADNTNRDKQTRQYYINLAKKYKVPVRYVAYPFHKRSREITKVFPRCIYFTGPMELAWHNNLYRAFNLPPSLSKSEVCRVSPGVRTAA